MAQLIIDQSKITNKEEFIKLCPFGALTIEGGNVTVGAGCKMCKLCVKKGPAGAATVQEDEIKAIDKSLWRDITVYVDHDEGKIHPVTYELIGKALELAESKSKKSEVITNLLLWLDLAQLRKIMTDFLKLQPQQKKWVANF